MLHTDTLKKNHEFRRLYHRGRSFVTPHLVVYAQRVRGPGNRVGFTVSTKLGHAVVRNRVRRRLREIYRLHEPEVCTGVWLVVVARGRAVGAKYAALEQSFLRACRELGLLREEKPS